MFGIVSAFWHNLVVVIMGKAISVDREPPMYV